MTPDQVAGVWLLVILGAILAGILLVNLIAAAMLDGIGAIVLGLTVVVGLAAYFNSAIPLLGGLLLLVILSRESTPPRPSLKVRQEQLRRDRNRTLIMLGHVPTNEPDWMQNFAAWALENRAKHGPLFFWKRFSGPRPPDSPASKT